MAVRVISLIILVSQVVYCEEPSSAADGLINRLSNGMKFAKEFLASESVARKVAEFVVRAFQTANVPKPNSVRRNPFSASNQQYVDENIDSENTLPHESQSNFNVNEAANPLTPLRHLVRLFGLQPTQISAVAVNALLFVAQMISTFFAGPQRPGRRQRDEEHDPLKYILNKRSKTLQDLITTAKNESLPDVIEDLVENQNTEDDISCVKLLICKITPFVSKMQKVVFGKEEDANSPGRRDGASAMYRHLPSQYELDEKSNICEQRHKECDLNDY